MSKPISALTPTIEQRLGGWIAIQERLARVPEPRRRPTITLSREFGCEGFPLAEALKAALEEATREPWVIHDKRMIEQVSEEHGVPLTLLQNLGDRSRQLEALGLMPSDHHTHDRAFEKLAQYVVPVAEAGNAIIVGRGAALLCKALTNCYHFRLVAPLDWRVDCLARRLDMPPAEARAFVQEQSRLRERFLSEQLGEDATSPRFYDAIYSNDRHPMGVMAASILAYVREAWPERGLFQDQ